MAESQWAEGSNGQNLPNPEQVDWNERARVEVHLLWIRPIEIRPFVYSAKCWKPSFRPLFLRPFEIWPFEVPPLIQFVQLHFNFHSRYLFKNYNTEKFENRTRIQIPSGRPRGKFNPFSTKPKNDKI
jgi:hypothetical protein